MLVCPVTSKEADNITSSRWMYLSSESFALTYPKISGNVFGPVADVLFLHSSLAIKYEELFLGADEKLLSGADHFTVHRSPLS